ncbi:uncharacterized protein LOC129720560 [Wyeomyia smithii]|uniref:uncharacterized protein LOC129720560 n=1 Tax=Wyeomyia smithii TaxID=174621 RepID=UPI002467C167|nr:uncharacterized protein LOC129720560 [Wyeomyia smithii]
MDTSDNHGELTVLRMEALNGKLPRNPFTIRTSVELCVGGKIVGAFPENRGEYYSLKVKNDNHVSKLLAFTELADKTKVKIIPHPTLNTCKCVVSCPDVIDMSEQELLNSLSKYGVLAIRRFTRRDGDRFVNTPSMILTIRGTVVPDYIDFGYLRVSTRPYYPSPMTCYRCWAFGHTRTRCQAPAAVCGNCSNSHSLEENQLCLNTKLCSRCDSNEHSINSKICPVFIKEKDIQRIRVDRGLGYPAARRLYESEHGSNSYATVANASNLTTLAELSAKVDDLTRKLAEKTDRIKELENGKNNRLQVVAANGTIEDLVKEVQQLKKQEYQKDREINVLRGILNNLRSATNTENQSTILDTNKTLQSTSQTQNQRKDKTTNKDAPLGTNNQSTPKRLSSQTAVARKSVKNKVQKMCTEEQLFSDTSSEEMRELRVLESDEDVNYENSSPASEMMDLCMNR